jgi:glycosyltransferase involved in cell wall biosynthesis
MNSAHDTEEVAAISKRPGISAVVICFNEEENIGPCLESLKWCDEIIVVDSFSTDKTLEICRRCTDRIIQRPWKGTWTRCPLPYPRRNEIGSCCSTPTNEFLRS